MKTISLTEFNQNPSRATRLADTEDVVVLRRGVATYRLQRIREATADPVEQFIQAGLLTPPRTAGKARHGRLRVAPTEVDLGSALDTDRSRLDG